MSGPYARSPCRAGLSTALPGRRVYRRLVEMECFVCSHSKMLPLEHAVHIVRELCSTVSHSLPVCVFAMVRQLAGFECCMAGVLSLNAGLVFFFKFLHLQVALV